MAIGTAVDERVRLARLDQEQIGRTPGPSVVPGRASSFRDLQRVDVTWPITVGPIGPLAALPRRSCRTASAAPPRSILGVATSGTRGWMALRIDGPEAVDWVEIAE